MLGVRKNTVRFNMNLSVHWKITLRAKSRTFWNKWYLSVLVSECGMVEFLTTSPTVPATENPSVQEHYVQCQRWAHLADASVWACCRSKSGHKQRVKAEQFLVTANVSHETISTGGYSTVRQRLPNHSNGIHFIETKLFSSSETD
jgi:hypothetical protein